LLATQQGMVQYATPPAAFRKERNRVDAEASPLDHYRFYLEGICHASADITNLLETGVSVVCDRYWLTTYVYHIVMGLEINAADFEGIVQPDLTILLLVSPDIQAARFLRRGLSTGDRRMINVQHQLERKYVQTLERMNIRSCMINTDNLMPQGVAQRIIAQLP
jgi:thymidylate kinase